MTAPALLVVEDLAKHYRLPRERLLSPAPRVRALQGVSFSLNAGRSLGVVGESGSGKSTLARLVMALESPTSGKVMLDGQDLHALGPAELRAARAKLQMVFQDPYGSLDPRRTILQTVAEPLRVLHGATPAEQRERAVEVLDAVGLRAADLAKYPHEFSGGQRQRIAIARALITRPKLIVADEPVSALDVSVQAQVLNLMQDLQDQFGLAFLFISHDLAVVDMVCDEVLVLYQGRVVEQGAPETLFQRAAHPYTRALMQAVPRLRPPARPPVRPPVHPPLRPQQRPQEPALEPAVVPAVVPAVGPTGLSQQREAVAAAASAATPRGAQATARPDGCAFAPRCAWVEARCLEQRPLLRALTATHAAACHRAEAVALQPGETLADEAAAQRGGPSDGNTTIAQNA